MKKNSFNYQELINCANGDLFGPGNARLPSPPMLMFDRITEISENTGEFKKGVIKAELDIKNELWFFDCHFKGDPVMPGCLGLDALWQLIGYFLVWNGNSGRGRALGAGEVKFFGQVLQKATLVEYEIDIKRIRKQSLVVGFADGSMKVDGKEIYTAKNLKVGLFKDPSGF